MIVSKCIYVHIIDTLHSQTSISLDLYIILCWDRKRRNNAYKCLGFGSPGLRIHSSCIAKSRDKCATLYTIETIASIKKSISLPNKPTKKHFMQPHRVFPKIGVGPQIINSNRVFHYFHHPFWGDYHPYSWKHPIRKKNQHIVGCTATSPPVTTFEKLLPSPPARCLWSCPPVQRWPLSWIILLQMSQGYGNHMTKVCSCCIIYLCNA